ncbi:MAG: hypothetical protein K2P94_11910 [Rhodospirillaceae bacterium]|nr:hypothetical protein [Rhodospirillaceae bacterium]
MTGSFLKWPLRLAWVKLAIGMLILMGLVVGYIDGTDRPRTFYIAMGATVVAILFWARKVYVLHQAQRPHNSP